MGKRNLIIIGLVLILLLLPASVYVVFQKANIEKQAQAPPASSQIETGCDQLDIVRNSITVEPTSLKVSDTVSFVAYCYAQGLGTISKIRFTLATPSGSGTPVEFLAFAQPQKDRENRRYFKATYPNVRFGKAGSYSLQTWAVHAQAGLSKEPFVRSFSISSVSTATPTPTPPTAGQASTGNKAPVCSSLSAIPLTGPAPLTVSLSGEGSDSDGQVVAFEFTFGDKAKQTVNKNVGSQGLASTSHVYQTEGNYIATLRVQDNSDNFSAPSSLCSVQISVSSSGKGGTTSAQLKAQPTKTTTPTPTPPTLPQAGISLPMVGFISAGLLLLTFGLLLAF